MLHDVRDFNRKTGGFTCVEVVRIQGWLGHESSRHMVILSTSQYIIIPSWWQYQVPGHSQPPPPCRFEAIVSATYEKSILGLGLYLTFGLVNGVVTYFRNSSNLSVIK